MNTSYDISTLSSQKNIFMINSTTLAACENAPADEWQIFFRALLISGFLLIFIIGTCSNFAVILLALRPSNSCTVNTLNKYILSLSVSDLIYIAESMFFTITNYGRKGWIFGDIGCRLILTFDLMTMHVSVYILSVMSVERYVAVVHPMRSLRYRSPVCARRLNVAVWVLSLLLVSPCIFGMRQITGVQPNGEPFQTCSWTLGEPRVMHMYMTAMCFTSFLIPSCVMLIVYSLLLNHFLRTVSPIRKSSQEVKRSKKRVAKIIFLIVIIYWICYLPFWTYQMMSLHVEANFDPRNIMGLLTLVLSYLNSCFNPFLYTLFPKRFNIWNGLCVKYHPISSKSPQGS
ncbi:urotensin-2 receptor-like [Apostichopus japonicus]|uniref:urotensin-2 receptor-like n=1 Tax=Stichopus japonicus TaxID=307972 RepID=UPI003AB8D4E7